MLILGAFGNQNGELKSMLCAWGGGNIRKGMQARPIPLGALRRSRVCRATMIVASFCAYGDRDIACKSPSIGSQLGCVRALRPRNGPRGWPPRSQPESRLLVGDPGGGFLGPQPGLEPMSWHNTKSQKPSSGLPCQAPAGSGATVTDYKYI